MGPWDVMSAHMVKRGGPPPGTCSFTRIRLGWIKPHQVGLVKPGETRHFFLAPLEKGGDLLTVKIPLEGGEYYLIENRQPMGFDRALPDSGILILRVDPDAVEGTGTVKVINPDPSAYNFSRAAYRLSRKNSRLFVDRENDLAIIPLWPGKEKTGVLITTPEQSGAALRAVLLMQKIWDRYPQPRQWNRNDQVRRCIQAFEGHDFEKCSQIAADLLKARGSAK